jgi:hypothetical protein
MMIELNSLKLLDFDYRIEIPLHNPISPLYIQIIHLILHQVFLIKFA